MGELGDMSERYPAVMAFAATRVAVGGSSSFVVSVFFSSALPKIGGLAAEDCPVHDQPKTYRTVGMVYVPTFG